MAYAVKRKQKKVVGLFIDGTGLDRATRRINRKVDLTALVRGVSSGVTPIVARYYTLIPYEDDSRQWAFLDAVARAGLQVIVKRLPPKGVTRQVSVEIEMAADIIAFAYGHFRFSNLSEFSPEEPPAPDKQHTGMMPFGAARRIAQTPSAEPEGSENDSPLTPPDPKLVAFEDRVITIVCPSRELAYPVSLANEIGVDTVTADFGQFKSHDILKSAAKWIDLSDSETIWR